MPRKIDVEALCAEKGLRITDQRKVIARVLSESEDHPDVEKVHARAAGLDAAAVFPKPFDLTELLNVVERLIRPAE